jgi:hypothetical protein
MKTPERDLEGILAGMESSGPAQTIESLVDLALSLPDAGESLLRTTPSLDAHAPGLRRRYLAYITAMERQASAALRAQALRPGGFAEKTDDAGRLAYRRVDDLFEHLDFRRARRFVMIGCGRMPVTVLQACERFPHLETLALDSDAEAIEEARDLCRELGLGGVRFELGCGEQHDFAGADVVFVANMVAPKSATLKRILDTGYAQAQVVLREPYGLGRLWADCAEDSLDPRVRVVLRGPGSRYLSRNVFLGGAEAGPRV